MEGIMLIAGIIGIVIMPILTIVAFMQVGLLYSVISIAFTSGVVLLIYAFWKKANLNKSNIKYKEKADALSSFVMTASKIMIIIGLLVFISCFLSGPTGSANTFTTCGWCGGSGIVSSGKICRLCNGGGGASGTSDRYTATVVNWLGVIAASSGWLIHFLTKKFKKKYYFTTY